MKITIEEGDHYYEVDSLGGIPLLQFYEKVQDFVSITRVEGDARRRMTMNSDTAVKLAMAILAATGKVRQG